jgi:hypothetical protein
VNTPNKATDLGRSHKSVQEFASALTNFLVLLVSIGCLSVVGLVRWVTLGHWPDTLRMVVVIFVCCAGYLFMFLRRSLGLVPRAKADEPPVVSASFAINLVMMLFLVALLMTWALTPWKP